ncbi:MAG: GntR family transcriptional regulator [Clostridiales Family XIII bacterium]|jgi:DNA-binding GntR family transcriptional regulator|nr:GntR family transcriptional regulator [Clostridiales Family XIII bacterium]
MLYKSKGLTQDTYEHILDMIMTKQLLPGDKISELNISKELDISRTPVRDAMRQLANEGIIDILPNKFARVADYSNNRIKDIGLMRIALESMAIRLACQYGSRADFLRLMQIAQSCYDSFKKGEFLERRRYDGDFHMELANISSNYLLQKFQKELYLRVQFIQLQYPHPIQDDENHVKEHFQIVDALMDFDEAKALAITTQHLTSFYDLKESYTDGFFNSLYM